MLSSIKAILKFTAFFLLCLLVVPLQMLVMAVHRGRGAYIMPWLWQKAVCFCFSLKPVIKGKAVRGAQTIFVSNHLSYLDIPVIGSVLRASFIAKKDVKSWPVFGFLSTLQQTAFVDRSRAAAKSETNSIGQMLIDGKSLILFPEGTSTDGRYVVPFKSSMFSIALQEGMEALVIQPFTITMQSVDGQAGDALERQDIRDIYSWHRDMDTELPVHLWNFAKSKGAKIVLEFHEPIAVKDHQDRKTLSQLSFDAVSGGLEEEYGKENKDEGLESDPDLLKVA